MNAQSLQTARKRIADCLQLDEAGRLVQRRDYLNLAGLELTDDELTASFDPNERDLPEISLSDLPHLRYLDLTGNRLTQLPACVTRCTGLLWLGLNFNRLTELPEAIGALTRLQRLYLRGNQLTQLPENIGKLKALVELDLTGCRIAQLPASLARLEALEHLALEEKALAADLRAVWKDGEWEALRRHLARVGVEEQRIQFVGKVVLVGSQEHGKTCLQRALRGERFQAGLASTDGMSRERLHLTLEGALVAPEEREQNPGPREDVIDFTLWDMGGQESYQHTHQMFFTPSAVYLVVTLPRRGGSVQDLDRWIELVKRRTEGKATVIVVSTWRREYPPDRALTLEDLRAKHGEMIRALVSVDSDNSGGEEDTGIPELRKLLATVAREPKTRCRHTWLPGWAEVLNELANTSAPFLRWPDIESICERHGITDPEEQRRVIRTGHYTGALLWREDIPAGEEVVILNPDWLSRAVARLLDDKAIRRAHGLVNIPELDRVWAGEGRDGTPGYAPETYPALIELMEINELAYRPKVPGKKVGEGHLLLIPQMVEDLPACDVEEKWQSISPEGGAETVRVIAFRKLGALGYETVPDLIYLLIFRLREFSLGRDDYQQAVHWQRGLLVTDDYGSAGKIELDDKGELLRVTVRHRLGDGLMHSIVHRIGVRDDGYWKGRGLEKVEFIPCGNICARGTPDAGLISMEDCVAADRAGNQSVRCETCREYVNIRELLKWREVIPAEQQALLARLTTLIRTEATATRHTIREESAETRQLISELWRFLRMQGDAILDAFTSEWKDGPRLFSLIPIKGKRWDPQTWTTMSFRVTVWCEASFRPVPLFRERKPGGGRNAEFRGSEIITIEREWLRNTQKLLQWGSLLAYALATGGAGLVTMAGGIVSANEEAKWRAELALQREAFEDLAESISGEGDPHQLGKRSRSEARQMRGFGSVESLGFGSPEEDDLKLIRFLREEFKKQDPTWGGLKPRNDAKFGRIWAHPRSGET